MNVERNKILQRLERLRALYARPGSEGERQAAARAIVRLQQKLNAVKKYQGVQIREYQFEVFEEI